MSAPFVHRLWVRYVECDMQGIAFNAHYYTWMDIAHAELIRALVGPLSVLHDLGTDVVVAESSARYLAPARYDQELDVEVALVALSTSSMTTTHTFTHDGTTLALGRVRHVCVSTEDLTKAPWPEPVRSAFAGAVHPEGPSNG